MAKANRFCDPWLKLVPELHDPAQTTVTVDELCQRMQRATPRFAGKLDAVFSMVSGINFLLPTPEDTSNFGDSDRGCSRVLRLQRGFKVEGNPKAHVFFDMHLLEPFVSHGGLANKTEDPVEFDHQEWKNEEKHTTS
jgi:hypothetical protein